jgi:hypothetical protein
LQLPDHPCEESNDDLEYRSIEQQTRLISFLE